MPHEPQKFVVTDPRSFDGNVYEVAQRAVAQLRALERLIELSLLPAEIMARNAELERQMTDGGEPDAPSWADSPQGRMFARIREQNQRVIKALDSLERAVSYDPRHPPVA